MSEHTTKGASVNDVSNSMVTLC